MYRNVVGAFLILFQISTCFGMENGSLQEIKVDNPKAPLLRQTKLTPAKLIEKINRNIRLLQEKGEEEQKTKNKTNTNGIQIKNVVHEAELKSSAAIIYNKNKDSFMFLTQLDEELFKRPSIGVQVYKGVGGLVLGLFTPVWLSNLVLYSTAALFDTTIGDGTALGVEIWIISTTYPAALRTAYDVTEDLGIMCVEAFRLTKAICCSEKTYYKTEQKEEGESNPKSAQERKEKQPSENEPKKKEPSKEFDIEKLKPVEQKKILSHRMAYLALALSNILNAAIPTALMWYDEKHFPVASWLSTAYMFTFFSKNYWDTGKKNIDRAFDYYVYQDEVNKLKRKFLINKIQDFLGLINSPVAKEKEKYVHELIRLVSTAIMEKEKSLRAEKVSKKELEKQSKDSDKIQKDDLQDKNDSSNNNKVGTHPSEKKPYSEAYKEIGQKEEDIISAVTILLLKKENRGARKKVLDEGRANLKQLLEEKGELEKKIRKRINAKKSKKAENKNDTELQNAVDISHAIHENGKQDSESSSPIKNSNNSQEAEGESEKEELENVRQEKEELKQKLEDIMSQEETNRFFHFREDIFTLKPPSWKEDFLERLSTALISAAYYARLEALRYTLETIFLSWGATLAEARTTAYTISSCECVFRIFVESRLHQQRMKGWLGAFSLRDLGDFAGWRKLSNGISMLNGVLFAMPNAYVAYKALLQGGCGLLPNLTFILPAGILDFDLYSHIFGSRNNKVITGLATLKNSPPTLKDSTCSCCGFDIAGGRAHINKWANIVIEYIDSKYNNATINNFYILTQDAD